jgi:hypothetical protein
MRFGGAMKSYIPRGYVLSAHAVYHLFKARHPDLAASVPAMNAEMGRLYSQIDTAVSRAGAMVALSNLGARHLKHDQPLGTISNADVARLRELDGIASEAKRLHTEAAIELRAALAEGDLVAFLNHEEMLPISKFRWRRDDGLIIVQHARLCHQVEETPAPPVKMGVVIKEADLAGWLPSVLQADPDKSGRGRSIEKSGTLDHSNLWRERVKAAGATDKALIAWAEAKYADEIPGREQLLEDHRDEFGTVRRINEKTIGAVIRPALASLKSQKGGRPNRRLSAGEK